MEYFRKAKIIGFSTGALSKGDMYLAIKNLAKYSLNAIELSALRENELNMFIETINSNSLFLTKYKYISFHAPSKLNALNETELIEFLKKIVSKKWMIIIHPNIITDFKLWHAIEQYICIENMDKRSTFGTNFKDFKYLFSKLPDASLCFDLAHSYQVDPTLKDAELILKTFKTKLKQIHISKLDKESKHLPLSSDILEKFQRIVKFIPDEIPIIIESPVKFENIVSEIQKVEKLFALQYKANKINVFSKRKRISHILHSSSPQLRKKTN